jgi:hypothetical protein
MTATGLPGKPNIQVLPIRPKAMGRPGLMSIFQKLTSPSRPISSRMKSASPTETPPVVRTTSEAEAASRKAASRASGRSGITPMSSEVTAQPGQGAMEGIAIGVVDFAGCQGAADAGKFVPGGKEGHSQTPGDADLGNAQGCHEAEFGGAHALAAGNRDSAFSQILACAADVLAAADSAGDDHLISLRASDLLHHDGVGAHRHDAAGHDAYGLPLADNAREAPTREGRAHTCSRSFGIGRQVFGTHGIAVHG